MLVWIHRMRKLSVTCLIFFCLVSSRALASSATADMVNTKIEPLEAIIIDQSLYTWDLSTKLYVLDMLETWGVALNTEKLALLRSEQAIAETRDILANEIMWECFGEHTLQYLKEQRQPIDAFDESSVPDLFIFYEALWLTIEPGTDHVVIQAHFETWLDQLRNKRKLAAAHSTPTPLEREDNPGQGDIMLHIERYMADVMSLTKQERQAANVLVTFSDILCAWQVEIRVQGDALRKTTKEWFRWNHFVTQEQDVMKEMYSYSVVLNPDGTVADASTFDELEYKNLIPADAWPQSSEVEQNSLNPYRQFWFATVDEKATFSKAYKPIVDQWLSTHPQYESLLRKNPDIIYLATRQIYGIPDKCTLQQEEAVHIAYDHCTMLTPSLTREILSDHYDTAVFFDVTRPDQPLWKILFYPKAKINGDLTFSSLFVVIDPNDGSIVRDQRCLLDADIEYLQ